MSSGVPPQDDLELWPRWVVEVNVPGAAANASAVLCNVTGVESRGHFRVSPARLPVPETANVNGSKPSAYVPNHVITAVTATHGFQSGRPTVRTLSSTSPVTSRAGRRSRSPPSTSTRRPAAPPAWILRVVRHRLGDSWYWTGPSHMGQVANVAAFAHRTDAGGPYRHIQQLQVGDLFTVTTGDRREYTYRMVRRDLTDAANVNILNAVRAHPGPTFSMVACTVGYDRSKSAYPDIWAPTSLKYRIVVTGELVSWREI